mmetsp:Transcript_1775/g.3397  ORF Transcript_1775/g.3397 Transcript_1775/m.3397 type:complete len:256 (-) Transcript_1775:698-1465(-)
MMVFTSQFPQVTNRKESLLSSSSGESFRITRIHSIMAQITSGKGTALEPSLKEFAWKRCLMPAASRSQKPGRAKRWNLPSSRPVVGHIDSTGTSMISSSPSLPSWFPPPSRSISSSSGLPGSSVTWTLPEAGPCATQSASAFSAASVLWRPLRQQPELSARLRQKPAAYHLQIPASSPAAPPPTSSDLLLAGVPLRWPLSLPLPLPLPPLSRRPRSCRSAMASPMASWSSCLALATASAGPRTRQIRDSEMTPGS